MNTCAKLSINAVAEVKALPNFATRGEVCTIQLPAALMCVITDAWYDSTSNAFHTTCLESKQLTCQWHIQDWNGGC